jgi:hypothetical protein
MVRRETAFHSGNDKTRCGGSAPCPLHLRMNRNRNLAGNGDLVNWRRATIQAAIGCGVTEYRLLNGTASGRV